MTNVRPDWIKLMSCLILSRTFAPELPSMIEFAPSEQTVVPVFVWYFNYSWRVSLRLFQPILKARLSFDRCA